MKSTVNHGLHFEPSHNFQAPFYLTTKYIFHSFTQLICCKLTHYLSLTYFFSKSLKSLQISFSWTSYLGILHELTQLRSWYFFDFTLLIKRRCRHSLFYFLNRIIIQFEVFYPFTTNWRSIFTSSFRYLVAASLRRQVNVEASNKHFKKMSLLGKVTFRSAR